MRKRTDAIEQHVDHARTPQGSKEQGVFVVPRGMPGMPTLGPPLSIEDWEAVAIPEQERLMREVRNPEDKS